MSTEALSQTWPQGEPESAVRNYLSQFSSGAFVDQARAPAGKFRILVDNIEHRNAFCDAIRVNGGESVHASMAGSADVIVAKNARLYETQFPNIPVCPPKYIYDCLHAGRILDPYSYEHARATRMTSATRVSSKGSTIDVMETMAAVATAEAEAEAAVEGAIAGDRQPLGGQSLAYLHRPPTNSNTHGRNRSGDTDDDDVLDAEDRHVNTMLSLKSKSIAEYPPFAVDSPGGQSNYSVAMSDSDFRIKQHLDSRVRSFHEMAAVTDHHQQQQQQQQQSHQYLRSSKYAQSLSPQLPNQRPSSQQSHRSQVSSIIERFTSPPLPTSGSGNRAHIKPSLVSSASRSFQKAKSFFEASSPVPATSPDFRQRARSPMSAGRIGHKSYLPSSRGSRTSPRRARGRSRRSVTPTHVSFQDNVDDDILGVDRLLSVSPELILPESQMPHIARAEEYLETTQNGIGSRPAPVSASNTESGSRKAADLSDDDEEYPDPNSFLNTRQPMSKSISPELGSPSAKATSFSPTISATHKPAVSADVVNDSISTALAMSGTAAIPVPTVTKIGESADRDAEKEGPEADDLEREVERASSMAKLGKRRRRRTGSSDDEYDQDPVPRAIDKDHELVQVNSGYLNQLSERRSTQLPLTSPQTRTHDNIRTPLSMRTYRHKIKVVPFSSKPIAFGPYSPAKRIRMSHVENLDSSDVGGESIPTPLFVHMPNSAPVQGTFPDVVVIHPGDHISTESPDILAPQSSQLTDSTGTNPSARQPFDLGDGNPVTHISQTPDDASHANATVDHGATPVVTQSVSVPSTNHSDITQATQEIEQTSDSDENDDDMFEDASEVQSQIGTDGSKQLEPGMENVDNAGKPDVPLDKNEGDSGSDSDLSLPTPPTPTQKDINHLLGSSASIIDSAPEQSVTGRANSENADDDTLSGGDKNGDTDETGDKDDALSRHSANLTESDSSSDSSPDSKVDPDAVSSSNSSVSSDADSEADTDSDEAAADESADDATNDADNIGSSQIAESVAAAVAVAAATRSKSGWTRRESESGEDIIEKKQPTVDVFDDEWKIGDREVSMDEHTGKLDMPALLSSPHRPTTRSQTYIVSNEATSAEKHAAAGRKRRVSSSRRLSTCQRLLQLQQQMNESADGSPGLGIMLDSSALGSNGTSGINGATPMSVPSSPSRRATFSGAMRVFGEGEPEVSDRDRLVYMRRLKGLIHGTELTAREGLRVLYFCTGNWANARKQILQGPDSLPEECVWNPEDDSILRSDSSTDKVEDLRNRRGNLEVYRRMQFLNTFHGTGMSV